MKINLYENKFIELRIKNARTLVLTHNVDSVKTVRQNNIITELQFYNKVFKINENIEIESNECKYNYFIRHIEEEGNYKYCLYCTYSTKTNIFVLPMIGLSNSTNGDYFYNTYLYNSYLYCEQLPEFNDGQHIFLIYRFFQSHYFKTLEQSLISHSAFIKTFEPNPEFTMYVMEIPKIFHDDVKRFLKGKYSRMSTTAKSKIIIFHGIHADSEMYGILMRDERLKDKLERDLGCVIPDDVDLHSKPVIEHETFTYLVPEYES